MDIEGEQKKHTSKGVNLDFVSMFWQNGKQIEGLAHKRIAFQTSLVKYLSLPHDISLLFQVEKNSISKIYIYASFLTQVCPFIFLQVRHMTRTSMCLVFFCFLNSNPQIRVTYCFNANKYQITFLTSFTTQNPFKQNRQFLISTRKLTLQEIDTQYNCSKIGYFIKKHAKFTCPNLFFSPCVLSS